MRNCTIVALLVVATLPLFASSNLVGTNAVLHCGSDGSISVNCPDDAAILLRFSDAKKQARLEIDFVLRGKDLPNEHRLVEVFVTSPQRSGSEAARVAFQADRQQYPLAINVDNHGVAKSVLTLEDFVRLTMTSTLQGTAFGEHFVASDQQMFALRLAVGRWAAQVE